MGRRWTGKKLMKNMMTTAMSILATFLRVRSWLSRFLLTEDELTEEPALEADGANRAEDADSCSRLVPLRVLARIVADLSQITRSCS
jgi:hypothetical protein